MSLETTLKNSGIAGSSVANYSRILKMLNNDTMPDTLDFLKDTDTIIKRVKTINQARVNKPGAVSDNTIKSRLTAILSCIKKTQPVNPGSDFNTIYIIYRKEFDLTSSKITEHLESGDKTPRETQNWITKEELDTIIQTLKEKAETPGAAFNNLQDYLLVSLYYYLPPQRQLEYSKMRIITGKAPIRLSEDNNYLLLDAQKMIINQHKTAGTSGTKEIDLTKYPEFMGALMLYLSNLGKLLKKGQKYASFPLLQYAGGASWDRPDMIRENLNRIFKKRVGTGMLRKIISTEKAPATKQELKEHQDFAKDMGHSTATHNLYYIKN